MAATRFVLRSLGEVLCNQAKPINRRLLICNKLINRRYARGYEGDGKTFAVMLNKKSSSTLFIDNVFEDGFKLSDGTELGGSLIIFPHSLFSWHVERAEDVNEDALILFKILEPKVDLLIFGYGNREAYTPQVRKQFTEACKKIGIRYEALPTVNAVGVFNFMSEDRRFAAAALIPPIAIDVLKLDRTKPAYVEDDDYSEVIKEITYDKDDHKYIK